ncbi:PHP domain-containing protein [Pseudactinotalea sp.]|uniref:PHP domain-containing protein n=1 Tax=Pseudactinotalea sp. TaxID=1926260 RepID=UPI003B3BD651
MRIDLHVHSNVSDGTDAPDEVMRAARSAVDVVALTDHDTTAGWDAAASAVAETGVALVRGTEISTEAGGISVHLLSYLHDPADPALTAMFERARDSRASRARTMVELIGQDLDLTWEDVVAQATDGATIGRPHIADALVARGHVPDRAAAFGTILRSYGPYYVRYWAPSTVEAVAAVRAAGGVPVMAHARASTRGRTVSLETIRGLAAAGLAGLEVDHPDHTEQDRDVLRDLAAELGLLVTGSSDYHGTGKPNRLGECTTAPEVLDQIEAQGRLPVLRP